MNRRQGLALSIILIVILAVATIAATGLIPVPDLSGIFGSTSSTTGTSNTSTVVLTTTTLSNTVTSNANNPFGGTTVGNASINGLQQALQGNSGLSNFLSARACGLTGLGIIQFCDTFPDNSLDAKKWLSVGTITVTPGNVQFQNATMRTKQGFYYGKFASFQIEINVRPPRPPVNGGCPPGWPPALSIHGKLICIDYSVWGFGRIDTATSIMWGIYWEQNGTMIRSHTRYENFFTHTVIDEVSGYQPIPSGVTEYGINWNIDAHGAYVQFIYKNHHSIVYFSKHTTAVPKTFLYLFAASNGTAFTLHRVVVLPAWAQGPNPLAALSIRPEYLP